MNGTYDMKSKLGHLCCCQNFVSEELRAKLPTYLAMSSIISLMLWEKESLNFPVSDFEAFGGKNFKLGY